MAEENEPSDPGGMVPYRPRGIGPDATGKRPPVEMSFDPRTPDGAIKLLLGTMEELPSVKSQVNKVLCITDLLSHDAVSFDKETGAETKWRRSVLFTADGKAYDCGSMGIDKCLAILSYVAGPPPWTPGINCTVTLTEIGGRKQWLTLKPDRDEIAKRLSKRTGRGGQGK